MIKVTRIILKICFALVLAIFTSLWWIQEDAWFIGKLEAQIEKALSESIGSSCVCKVKQLNIFTGFVLFNYCQVNPQSKAWSVKCPRTMISFSWLKWLLTGDLKAQIVFFKPELFSTQSGAYLLLADPINHFLKTPSNLLSVESIAFRQGRLSVKNDFGINYDLNFSADIFMHKTGCSVLSSVTDGKVEYYGKELIDTVNGSNSLFVDFSGKLKSGKGLYNISSTDSFFDKKKINLSWDHINEKGSFLFYTPDRIYSLKGGYKKVKNNWVLGCGFKIPLDIKHKFNIKGDLFGQIQSQYSSDKGLIYQFTLKTPNLFFADIDICNLFVSGEGDMQKVLGQLNFIDAKDRVLQGPWTANISTKQVSINLNYKSNKKDLSSQTEPTQDRNNFLNIKLNQNNLSTNWYVNGEIFNLGSKDSQKIFSGEMLYDFNQTKKISSYGLFDHYKYEITIDSSVLKIESFSIEDTEKDSQSKNKDKYTSKKIINFNSKNSALTCGVIQWDILKKIIETLTGKSFYGSSTFSVGFKGFAEDFKLKFLLKDGTIRLPLIYNMLTSASGLVSADLENKQLLLSNFKANLHKGLCKSSLSTFGFNQFGQITNMHVPLIFSNCFLNWHKDFFGVFSGDLTFQYSDYNDNKNTDEKKKIKCSGQIILEQSHLKANLFSSDFKKNFESPNVINTFMASGNESELDINIITKQPLTIKTDFLNATAKVDLEISKSFYEPFVSGIIELENGSLNFPYKKLFITSGKLIFKGTKSEEIAIELTAVNTIKKYPITMTVRGTLADPVISFEAAGLKQEQIITLLLSGSEDGSLYWAMPRMAMQYLHTLIFGSSEEVMGLGSLKSLFTGLKKVRIVPKNNSSNGNSNSFEGALEVDITDRLHAKVQNDLSLSKDTAVEVEYTLSDEMSIRGIRDAKSGVGGEINMHWKLP